MKTTQHNEKHSQWRGEKAKYMAKHQWVYRHWGQPSKCEECQSTDKPKTYYQWANISDKYLRDRNDWKRLCALCHSLFDRGKKGILKPQVIKCIECSKLLPKYPINKKRRLTCSNRCLQKFYAKKRTYRLKPVKHKNCLNCSNQYISKKKSSMFCSRSCKSTFQWKKEGSCI